MLIAEIVTLMPAPSLGARLTAAALALLEGEVETEPTVLGPAKRGAKGRSATEYLVLIVIADASGAADSKLAADLEDVLQKHARRVDPDAKVRVFGALSPEATP